MQIVPATLGDARAVAQIHVDSWRAAYRDILAADYLASLSVDKREAMWRRAIESGETHLLVAKGGGDGRDVLGWISFAGCRDAGAPATQAEIWALYVAPRAWTLGVGRGLWAHARDRMRAQGYTSCSLWVFAQNERAIRFYRAAGFAPAPLPEQTFELGGRQLREVCYVCRLGDAG
ncbi:MAG TPA: GNAT family N-acetyltransferase [Burkholderiaceae bacterium]